MSNKVGKFRLMNSCLPPQNAGAYLSDNPAEVPISHSEFQPNAEFDLEDGDIYGLGAMVTPPHLLNPDDTFGGAVV